MHLKSLIKTLIISILSSVSIAVSAQDSIAPNSSSVASSEAESFMERSQTFLILNSYNENSPWTRAMVTPITYYIANDDRVHAELINLNSVLVTDTASYNRVTEQFFNSFKGRKIDYVAFIGQLAFSMRDKIKEIWGDIPMLLITRDLNITDSNEYYFSGYEKSVVDDSFVSLADLKDDFNFTAIYVPDYYKETIQLMDRLLPGMDEVVFFSDAAYYNRYLAKNIEIFLLEEYPTIKYRWVQASQASDIDLQYYLVHKRPRTGLLMSSWFYETTGALGYPSLVSGDLNLLFSSTNPVFSLRQPYMSLGAIGGVFADPESVREYITEVVNKMLDGVKPRDIKFYSNRDNIQTILSYPLVKEYGLNVKNCPDDTVFIDKPLSFWQKYSWQVITTLVFVTMITILFVRRNLAQKHEIENLERHKQFVENMPVPYSEAKIKYNQSMQVVNIIYTVCNQAFEAIIAESGEKKKTYVLFPAKMISEKTAEMLETGRPVSFLHHFPRSDKYYIFTLCIVDRRKRDTMEYVDLLDVFAVEVTQRLKNERNLREITQRLDLTLNVANIIPWEWDIKEDIMYFGATDLFRRYDKLVSDDPAKKDWSAIPQREYMAMIVKEDREELRHVREQVLLGTINQFHMEYRLSIARHGKDCIEWLDVNGAVSERDASGAPIKVIGSMLLVTERKNQEIDLIEAREKAKEADYMKSAFLANMSHEIRTPLNAIVGFSSLMCSTEDASKRKEYSKVIAKNNDILLTLIDDVLDLAKIESNTIDINYATVDINNMMHTIGESIKGRLQKGVALNVVNGASKCFVRSDSNRLAQVLMNLLGNACKFTVKGSITYGYDIIDNNELYFYVKDTGIGISEENQRKLFKRFDKLNNFVPGTGLGLSICKTLVERLGGSIGMESRGEGKGSKFWFSLPYDPVEPDDDTLQDTYMFDDINREDVAASNESQPQTQKHALAPGRERPLILAAEDIEGNYLLLKNFVTKDYDLIHAWNGKEAVNMALDKKPDLILMDINMPCMDGYQATAEIRKTDPDMPIVAVTAYAYASDRKRILSSGFNDYIAKPVDRKELHQTIKRYI